jgi:glycosyltransferase
MPPHPTFFVKKQVYQKYKAFDLRLKSAADYELMLRFIHKYKISVAYIPDLLVIMRAGGKSNSSFRNRLRANKEDRLAWVLNGLNPNPFTLLLKPLRKVEQYLFPSYKLQASKHIYQYLQQYTFKAKPEFNL